MDDLYLFGTSTFLLVFSIIFLSLLQEDLAIITGALLTSDNLLSLPLAIFAIFIGIAIGDLGLYFLGKTPITKLPPTDSLSSASWFLKLKYYNQLKLRAIRYRLLTNNSMRYMRNQLRYRTFLNLFIIRFIPGVRLIAYVLCGFLRISLYKFSLAIFLATAVWVAFVFVGVYQFGGSEWFVESHNKWLIMPIAIAIMFVINYLIKRFVPLSQNK